MVRWAYKRMADLRVSTTDPDVSPMHQKNKSANRLGYLTHYVVVDGGKARVILGVLVTGAEVTENLLMQEMLFRSTFRWRLRPRSVTGDAAYYGTRENIAAIEKASIRAYTALLPEQGKRTTSLLTIEDFVYDAEKGRLHLPPRRDLAPSGLRSQGRIRKVRRVRTRPPATSAPSRVSARTVRRDDGSVAASKRRSISKGSERTATPKPTAGPYANAPYG